MKHFHILYIDDDPDDQEIFQSALEMASADVDCTVLANAQDALYQLENKQITPSMIFLDLNMPVMTGQQFLTEIKQKDALKHIPVIIFSTTSNPVTARLTRELGASDFIVKPDRFSELVQMFRSLLKLS